jgi:hypothetical protein
MDTKAFLGRVLPSSGGYYYSNYGTTKLQQSAPLATLDDLFNRITERSKRRENVYFAVGVYGESRTANAAADKKALYLDLDCGEGKGFADKKEAITELARFCKASGMPLPNIIVDSGHGIHSYWTLTNPIPISQWHPMADRLKQLCVEHEFAADQAITADAARILRVPGTYNYKDPSHPIPCRIIKADPQDFEVDALRPLSVESESVPEALRGQVTSDDLGANLYGERQYFAGDMIEQCAALRHTRDTGGKGQAGMLWHKLLHLLAFTEDGADYVHPISNKHDQYDPARTDARFEYSKQRKDQVGPTLCKTIENYLPSKCATCPFRGNIKTPLVLGKPQDSFLPGGWKMTKEGVFKPTKFDEKGQACDWVRVIPYMFSDVELYSTAFGNGLQLSAHNGPRKHTTMILGVTLAGDARELAKQLMMDRIMLTDTELQEFRRIMIPWMRKMEMIKDAKPAPVIGLGWLNTGEKIGFATGHQIFMEDGTTSPISGVDRTLCKDYSPKGDPQVWRDAAAAVMGDGCFPIQAAVLTSFAAPLIGFTGVQGSIFSLHSRDSGTGKSSALKVAQAVWGDPVRGINALNDTTNSMTMKYGFLRNLPAYWDEVRMRDEVRGLVGLIYSLTQGRGKSRLSADAKMREVGTWATINTLATNESVLDHVDHVSTNTDAGRLRVFEVDVPVRSMRDTTAPFKLRDLAHNYGHIGEDYAAWLAKNHAAVDQLMQKMLVKVTTDLNASNNERFWTALCTSLIVAAHIVNKRGYVAIDVPAFQDWLYREFQRQRGDAVGVQMPVEQRALDAVIAYADTFRDQIVVVDHATTRAQKNVGAVHVQPPIREFLALLAVQDKVLRVKKAAFRKWLYEKLEESPSELIAKLIELGSKEHKASVSAGIANTVNARVTVLDIDLKHSAFQPMLEDYDA